MDNLLKNIKMEVGLSDYAEFVMNKLDQMIENETDEAKKEELSNLQERISGGIEWFNEANLRLDDLVEATHIASNVMDNNDYQVEATNEVASTPEQTLPSDIFTDEVVEDVAEPINEVAVNEEESLPEATDEQPEEQNEEAEEEEVIIAEEQPVEENAEEVVAEETPVEETTEEVVADEPVAEETVAEETPVEETTEEVVSEEQSVSEETQVIPAVELPVIDEQPVAEETPVEEKKEEAQSFEREAPGTVTDKGVSITPDQKNNLAGSLEVQEALIGSVGAAPMANEVVQPESVVAEQPVGETTEMTPEQELEKMTQEYTEALSSGDEAKAEELSNAISEKNKQLTKAA